MLNEPLKGFKRDDAMRWLAFSLIAIAVLIFYFPTLYFPPRADQVVYLAETANLHHPWDLILGCYDHNRHRIFGPGDELLFRPLIYVLLGIEQVLFGHHFWAWQLLGIGAHLGLVWVLLRLLWHLTDPWLAFAGVWVFALSLTNYEMVSWPHLSSYMLMMICMVGAIEQVDFCFEDRLAPWGRIFKMLVYFFIACFIYETANIFVLLITSVMIVTFPKMRWRLSLLMAPVVIYGLSSYYNFTSVNHITHFAVVHTHGVSTWKYLWGVIDLTLWWLYEGLFDGMYHYILVIRTMIPLSEAMVFKPLAFKNPQVFCSLLMLSSFLGLAWLNRREFVKRVRIWVILWGMVLSYVAVIVVGRYQEKGSLAQTVGVNSYFLYLFWAIMLMVLVLTIIVKEKNNKIQQWLVTVFVAASLVSGLWQGEKIYTMAAYYSNDTNDILVLVTTLDLLIQEKKSEPDFSFYVAPLYPGNFICKSIRKPSDPPQKEYTFAELIYPQYFRPEIMAKYKFLVTKTP